MKKVLICGGSGFIGKNVIKYLKSKNYRIFATYNTKIPKNFSFVKWIKSDLTFKENVKNTINNFDIVIQCAAVTSGAKEMITNPFSLIGDNVVMNSLILKEVVKKNIKHFIFLSCSVMYHHSNKKLRENQYNPKKKLNKVYEGMALSKVYIENMCKFFSERSKTKFTVLRHTNIYGPHDKFENNKSHFMASTITKAKYAKNKIEIWGNGNERRDFLYIDDLCSAIECVIKKQKKKFELLNISYGKNFSIKEIVKKVRKCINKNYKIIFDRSKPSININISVDNSKAARQYKWQPKNKIDEGIKKTISWYLRNY